MTNREGLAVPESDDTVEFGGGVTLESASFAKDGDDLLISLDGTSDSLRVKTNSDRSKMASNGFGIPTGQHSTSRT